MSSVVTEQVPDAQGHFGPYGGRYVPETLMHPLQQLEEEYFRARLSPTRSMIAQGLSFPLLTYGEG